MTATTPLNKNLQALATATTVVMAIVLGLTMAYSIMQLIKPRVASISLDPPAALNTDITPAYSLFGEAAAPSTATAAMPAASTSSVILKGVFAVNGDTLSAAIINVGGKDKPILIGEEIEAGLKLSEVGPDYIVLSRGGVPERVALSTRSNKAGAANVATSTSSAISSAATNFRLSVNSSTNNNYSLSRQELNTSLQDPRQLGVLGRVGVNSNGSGVRVEEAPAGSLSEKLGLRPGDVITSINGTPITGPGDMARMYQQFATTPQVRAEVKRGGTPVVLTYNIQ
jgi:general secretion pathway protein C